MATAEGEFYKKDPQISLFDFESGSGERDRLIKDANPERIKEYIIGRLQSTFPCVSKHPRIFKNKNNSPLFLFCFAISNDSEKAQGLALKIANHILKPKTGKDGDILKTITRKTMLYKTGVEYGDYTMNHVTWLRSWLQISMLCVLQKKRFGQIATYDEWLEPFLVSNTLEILDREIHVLRQR